MGFFFFVYIWLLTDNRLFLMEERETKVASTEETKEMKQEPIADINLEFNW